jgi:hypothetical protein
MVEINRITLRYTEELQESRVNQTQVGWGRDDSTRNGAQTTRCYKTNIVI